ncbi:MAG: YggS family pyridoxal phosphate-dependent enzyme [Deltaproteobacteria bacterium]|nr:YggS family pyridoxal phosphate-dependent enzyme [Deltaproteobacteria bacterium]
MRWWDVRDKVVHTCMRIGRDPSEVTIVAVAKKHTAAAVREAIAAGVTDIGENYVQELLDKQPAVATQVRWHFIGRLQRNKVRQVVGRVALIHAVDSLALAQEIDKRAAAIGVVQPILLAVNIAGDDAKGGVTPASAPMLLGAFAGLANLRCDGFMTMPPEDPVATATAFNGLRELRDRLRAPHLPLPILSMGMTGDFEQAIAAGATHLRIGTAIFGERPAPVDDTLT